MKKILFFFYFTLIGNLVAQDLPSKGSSLFDLFIKEQGSLPYPFENLLQELKVFSGSSSIGQEGLLIPFGRSLQKPLSVTYNPYIYPRVIVAEGVDPFHASEIKTPAKVFSTKSRIFLGFHEPKKQIEVISWNEALGRFEFQIVTQYDKNQEPKIYYAKRQLCLSCHQNQGPIFPEIPWLETNANFISAGLIRRARDEVKDTSDKYQGVWIRDMLNHTDNDSRSKRARVAQFYESSVFRADAYLKAQETWKKSCLISRHKKMCRERLLSMALTFNLLTENEIDKQFKSLITTYKKEDLFTLAKLLSQNIFFIKPRNPVTEVELTQDMAQTFSALKAEDQIDTIFNRIDAGNTTQNLTHYAKEILELPLKVELDPLTAREEAKENQNINPITMLRHLQDSLFSVRDFMEDQDNFEENLNLFLYDENYSMNSQIDHFEQELFNTDDVDRTDPPQYDLSLTEGSNIFSLRDKHPWAKVQKLEIETKPSLHFADVKVFKAIVTNIEAKERLLFCFKTKVLIKCSNKRYDKLAKHFKQLNQRFDHLLTSDIFFDLKIAEIIKSGSLSRNWKDLYQNVQKPELKPVSKLFEVEKELTHPSLKLILKSCGRCHFGSEAEASTLFVGESDFELKLEVEKNRDKMLKRLKTLKNMPPRASDEYQEIQMNPKLRNEMIEALESI
jgi:hypothetical protein